MAKKTEDAVKTTTETRTLKCELTDAETREAADVLARALDTLECLEDEKKKLTSDFKAQIEGKEAELRIQKNLVRNKYEHRPTQCKMTLNYTKQMVIVTRDDTGAVVVERKMLEEEKQMQMGFDGEKDED